MLETIQTQSYNYSQARHCVSLIPDPLWKSVCTEVLSMMGPFSALKIWQCTLEPLTSQDKVVKLDCPTQEIANFVEQYAFVMVGSLQRYFPALKELRTSIALTK